MKFFNIYNKLLFVRNNTRVDNGLNWMKLFEKMKISYDYVENLRLTLKLKGICRAYYRTLLLFEYQTNFLNYVR